MQTRARIFVHRPRAGRQARGGPPPRGRVRTPWTVIAKCCDSFWATRVFFGSASVTARNAVRAMPPTPPRSVSKNSPRTKSGNTRISRVTACVGAQRPTVCEASSGFGSAPARGHVPKSVSHRPESQRPSFKHRRSFQGSANESRVLASISRSTFDGPLDERGCRRNRPPNGPRAKRGARARSRARSDRSRTCSTIRASSR